MIRAALATVLALGVAVCNAGVAGAAAAGAAMTQPPMQTGGTLPARSVLAAMPDYNGIGPLRFGMSAEEMRRAWGRALYGHPPTGDPQACYYLLPRKGRHDLTFMVEDDRFVRVDVTAKDKTAPGGGRVGMPVSQIRQLYAGHIRTAPAKYNPDARVLSVVPPRHEHAKLVFDTDASGHVASWRIGVAPQVDYVEGCG